MKIHWKTERLKQTFENESLLRARFRLDSKEIRGVYKALRYLEEAESINKVPKAAHCHLLKEGKKLLYYTVDLPSVGGGRGKNRLCFIPVGDCDPAHIETITEIEIIGIKNTHKG